MALAYECDVCGRLFKPDFVEYINKHYTDKNKQIKEADANETNN